MLRWREAELEWVEDAPDLLDRLAGACADIARERIRWKAFLHAFPSLLAQDGVSFDKTSAWMGNSPEICRRH